VYVSKCMSVIVYIYTCMYGHNYKSHQELLISISATDNCLASGQIFFQKKFLESEFLEKPFEK